MIIRRQNWVLVIILLAICGYPLIASATPILGIPNTPASLTMRLFLIALCILELSRRGHLFSIGINNVLLVSLLCFWCLYLLRLYNSTFLDGEALSRPDEYYWMWGIGATLLPAMTILLRKTPISGTQAVHWLVVLMALILVLAFLSSSYIEFSAKDELARGRLELSSLNPISLGNFGGSCLLVSLFYIVDRSSRVSGPKKPIWIIAPAIICIFLGTYFLFLSGSRGPILSVSLALALYLLSVGARKLVTLLALAMTAVLFGAPYLLELASEMGINTVERIRLALRLEDTATLSRLDFLSDAMALFLQSPFWGSNIELPDVQYNPHNIVAEALMSVGLLGGIPFLIIYIYGWTSAWSLLRKKSKNGWACLLFFQSATGSLFSGTVYGSSFFWLCLALIISEGSWERSNAARSNWANQ